MILVMRGSNNNTHWVYFQGAFPRHIEMLRDSEQFEINMSNKKTHFI